MGKKLVAYFSATGITAGIACKLAKVLDSDLFEIKPEKPYTSADLDWNDKSSRSSIEMNDSSSRPAIKEKIANMEQYDTVFLGFPIWWYCAPAIINTFLESYDFAGKNIVLFVTSGSSGLGDTQKILENSVDKTANWIAGKRFSESVPGIELKMWVNSLGL